MNCIIFILGMAMFEGILAYNSYITPKEALIDTFRVGSVYTLLKLMENL